MLVGIVCPGPSLSAWLGSRPAEPHDVWIGVNAAARAWACHWWVFGDAKAFQDGRPIGVPALFTQQQTAERFLNLICDRVGCTAWEQSLTEVPVETGWRRSSMTAAMVLAETLVGRTRPAEIRIYGCDWSGDRYFDGSPDTLPPSRYRREGERATYHKLIDWLKARGIACDRMIPKEAAAA